MKSGTESLKLLDEVYKRLVSKCLGSVLELRCAAYRLLTAVSMWLNSSGLAKDIGYMFHHSATSRGLISVKLFIRYQYTKLFLMRLDAIDLFVKKTVILHGFNYPLCFSLFSTGWPLSNSLMNTEPVLCVKYPPHPFTDSVHINICAHTICSPMLQPDAVSAAT